MNADELIRKATEAWDAQYTAQSCIENAENYARSEEPVAWMISDNCGTHFTEDKRDWYDAAGVESITPLYTHPKEWGGLTDDEIWEQWHTQPKEGAVMVPAFARAIEAKLKEKNT